MPRDVTTLIDILEAAERVSTYISGMKRSDFVANQMARAAVVREIEIMGEAAGRLSQGFRDAHAELPWKDITRLRNIYIHAYDRVDYDRVWRAANGLLPRVTKVIRAILPPDDQTD